MPDASTLNEEQLDWQDYEDFLTQDGVEVEETLVDEEERNLDLEKLFNFLQHEMGVYEINYEEGDTDPDYGIHYKLKIGVFADWPSNDVLEDGGLDPVGSFEPIKGELTFSGWREQGASPLDDYSDPS